MVARAGRTDARMFACACASLVPDSGLLICDAVYSVCPWAESNTMISVTSRLSVEGLPATYMYFPHRKAATQRTIHHATLVRSFELQDSHSDLHRGGAYYQKC